MVTPRRAILGSTLMLFAVGQLAQAEAVQAGDIPLTRAEITYIQNQVRLIEPDAFPRPVELREAMTPGDGLSTAGQSLAELLFNDNSLARLGEQSMFWFIPQTRSFQLTNGTALLLIQPGQGRTQVQTPNAVAGIQGSALFVRYNPETEQTIVGALTNSGIVACDGSGNTCAPVAAGQLAAIDAQGIRLFDFDLQTFYATSNLAQGLGLDQLPQDATDIQGAVRAETTEALSNQAFTENPATAADASFIRLTPLGATEFPEAIALPPVPETFDFTPTLAFTATPSLSTSSTVLETIVQPFLTTGFDSRNLTEPGEIRALENNTILQQLDPGNTSLQNFPGQGNGVTDGFPGQGNGVTDGFPGQGNGVTDGFPGQGNGVTDGFPGQGNGVTDGFPGQGNGVTDGFPGQGNGVTDGFPGQGNGVTN